MKKWFIGKLQNSKVYMCTKELKWTLEMAQPIDRAMMFCLGQYMRHDMEHDMPDVAALLDDPYGYPRAAIMDLYEKLEDLRNLNLRNITLTKKNLERFGLEMPEYSENHAKNLTRGIEIWMATLTPSITPAMQEETLAIWRMLLDSKTVLRDAIEQLRTIELKTAIDTGVPSQGMFSLGDQSWFDACNYVPLSVQKLLRHQAA